MLDRYMSDYEAQKLICEVGRRVYEKNFVAANDGNFSVKVEENAIWATPTGVSKGFMTPGMMVKLDMQGNVLDGTHRPSSEIKMHLRVYNENPEVNAVVHAHPPVATSHAIAGIPLDRPILPEAVIMLGTVPVAAYATPGSEGVADSIAPYCREHNAVLLANHGALTWGDDLMQAYHRMESLEHYALVMMYTSNIIQRYNELDCSQISDLVKARESMGIKAGGVPPCKEGPKQNPDLEKMIEEVVEKTLREYMKR
ncbi:MAG: class II aldolase/adducin family protein [Oscillospiraceae bacterium]|nr:class II aldolase/adducin family protein [Oscillospiraceae bacterium]MCL2278339.1 class II aldolase/adducin family protein [Oscillospiraceae bacterium]